jgi:uncharacterized membrane protein YgdD (TMEM256/DUF423 family)
MSHWRLIALAGALTGLLAVVIAAAGSHAVAGTDDLLRYRAWQSALLMHLFHAVALLALAAIAQRRQSGWHDASAIAMLAGAVLFCGSIYWRVFSGAESSGPLAPSGGLLLMAGWVFAIIGIARN